MVRSGNPTLNHQWILSRIFTEKRVGQKLSRRPPITRLLLQATVNKSPKLIGRALRQTRWVAETNRAHQGRPVGSLTRRQKRKMTHIKLQQGQPQAPYIPSVSIVVPAVRVRVEPFWTHVRARANIGITRVQHTGHDLADSKIRDLHFHLVVHQ